MQAFYSVLHDKSLSLIKILNEKIEFLFVNRRTSNVVQKEFLFVNHPFFLFIHLS